MDNPEEILHSLEEFSKIKPKDIPRELDDYLCYVAKTGDPVFKWSMTKCLFREKLLKVITDFYESTLTIDLPPCPNVDTFNYERMKSSLIEKLESFHGAPFTVQRISELLTNPRKEYNRADKFMRAIEKNILVVSTIEPGKYSDGDSENLQDTSFNGIPEPNDTPMDSSFSCNDLSADPDSSSPTYEAVNSDSQESFNSKADSDNSPAPDDSVKNEEAIDDSLREESNSNDSTAAENTNIADEGMKEEEDAAPEKESEGVICSTVPVRADSDPSDHGDTNETSTDSSSTNSNKEVEEDSEISESEKPFEPLEEEKVEKEPEEEEEESGEHGCEASRTETKEAEEEEKECETTTTEERFVAEEVVQVEASSASESDTAMEAEVDDSKEDLVSDSLTVSSNTCDDGPVAVECDTSDSCDALTSSDAVNSSDTVNSCDTNNSCDTDNSCDTEVEIKNDLQESVSRSESLSTSDNEVTSCGVFMKEGRIIVNELVVREASVIRVTAASSEPETDCESMEVDECQISSLDESDSSINETPDQPPCPESSDSQPESEKLESSDTS